MILDPEHEQMPRKALERLRHKIREVYEKVPFYHRAFDEQRFKPDDFHSLGDLRKLPFTNKLDFKDNYPYGLMATPLEQIVRIHASSGTTGKPRRQEPSEVLSKREMDVLKLASVTDKPKTSDISTSMNPYFLHQF